MKKLMIVMVGFLTLLSCNNQKDLTFNEMVNQTQVVAKGIDETALFYESTATKELNEVKSVFAGVDNTTIEVVCNSKGESVSKVIDSPFMEDEVIHLPVKLTLEEAEQILLDAGYGTGVEGEADWSVVVLRRPLEPGFNVAQYIFTTSKGYVSVNATTGEIAPVGLEGCPCPFKNPCICPEETLSDNTYTVEFDVDYQKCGNNPVVSKGGVDFGSAGDVRAGRVCSKNGYKNISKIESDIDLSPMVQREGFTGDWLNAAFYAVSSDKQPLGDGNYCDAEFTPSAGQPGYPCPFCQEIDFLETNGQKMFQHTLHLADGKGGPQRYEVSYTEAANTDCWQWDEMQSEAGNAGVHSLVGKIDPNKPFHMVVDFNEDYTNMIITLSQDGNSVKVFDMTEPSYPYTPSDLDMSKLKDAMNVGWWFTPSYHDDWSPGTNDPNWYINSGGECGWGTLCGDGGGWKLSNLVVTAEEQI
jgi:hypothetical protein